MKIHLSFIFPLTEILSPACLSQGETSFSIAFRQSIDKGYSAVKISVKEICVTDYVYRSCSYKLNYKVKVFPEVIF